MFDLFKRYVDEGYMKLSDEGFWFGKERMIFYYTTFNARELMLNSKFGGSRYLATKFIVSRKEGQLLMQQHGAQDMSALANLIDSLIKIINLLGIGKLRIVESDSKSGFAVLSGTSNAALERKAESPSDAPVDFVIGGLIAGTVSYYTKRKAYAAETKCVAQNGVEECTWVVGNKDDILNYIKDSAPGKTEAAQKTIEDIEAAENEIGSRQSLNGII
ncbi:MAG: hypothetical protein KGH94_05315 [Candidatus Micrarchaeota archaeon]|nr:hypothetical protein [Candidatus Micrarchaeota archaeon]